MNQQYRENTDVGMTLPVSFYRRDDVVSIARDLLGKVLRTTIDGVTTQVVVTETEAYAGVEDRASHAFGGRRTKRTEPMFGPAGTAYVYLCYGIHHLFNIVTNDEGVPHAVLVRAGHALVGFDAMLERRGKQKADKTLLAGPGSLAKALGISTRHTGCSVSGDQIRVEDHGVRIVNDRIIAGPRIGVDYAGDDALLPYRFTLDAAQLAELP